MDHISQLKNIRAEAIERLRNSADFKLAGRLGQLIAELGEPVEDLKMFETNAVSTAPVTTRVAHELPRPFKSSWTQLTRPNVEKNEGEDMIDDLVAEIENDAAELDALLSEKKDDADFGKPSSYFDIEKTESAASNGAAH